MNKRYYENLSIKKLTDNKTFRMSVKQLFADKTKTEENMILREKWKAIKIILNFQICIKNNLSALFQMKILVLVRNFLRKQIGCLIASHKQYKILKTSRCSTFLGNKRKMKWYGLLKPTNEASLPKIIFEKNSEKACQIST